MGAYDWAIGGATIKKTLDLGSLMVSGAYPRSGPRAQQVEEMAQAFGVRIAEREASIVSGNGPTIGNALVSGLYSVKRSEVYQYICIIPFKQHGTVADMTHAQRSEYFNQIRKDLIAKANIIVFMSGEKTGKDGALINSETVMSEFTLGTEVGRYAIPIATLGGSAALIHERISAEIKKKIHPYKDLPKGLFDKLADASLEVNQVIDAVFEIADWLVEHKLSANSRRSSVTSINRPHGVVRTVSGASINSIVGSPRSPSYGRSPTSASASASRHVSANAISSE